jgi:formylglycine-generating enzyme required for sulfatase activity
MKKIITVLAVLFICLNATSQNHYSKFTPDAKMKKAPYGFVWTETGKFGIKQSEVSVDEYLGFLEAITNDSSAGYVQRMKPSRRSMLFPYMDTVSGVSTDENDQEYRKISWINEDRMEEDARQKAKTKDVQYDGYFNPFKMPITGITYEQALDYAKWCTAIANMEMYNKVKDKSTLKQAVIYRLPTPAEYEALLKKGLTGCDFKDPKDCASRIKQMEECKNEKKCALCNVAGKDTCKGNMVIFNAFGAESLYGIYTFYANWIGAYNMQGNAAEMTSEKGKAMGGSYKQSAKDCLPGSVQNYTQPETWLGIRLVAEVVNLDGTNYFFDDKGRLMMKNK